MISAIAALVLAAAPLPQDEPRVECSVDRDSIYLGQVVHYQVILYNFEQPQPPTLAGFDAFEVQYDGERSQNFISTSMVNGVVKSNSVNSVVYNYRLRPTSDGWQTIPAPSVKADGGSYTGNPLRLQVRKPDSQGLVFVEVRVDKNVVYPMQPFEVTVDVYVRELPPAAGQSDKDPLLLLSRRPPALNLPWVGVPEGLKTNSLDSWIGPIRSNGHGFTINNLSSGNSVFGRQEAIFLPRAEWVKREDDNGEVHRYRRYTLMRSFEPTAVGEYSFGPATMAGEIISGIDNNRWATTEVFTLSGVEKVEVRRPPLEGRPAEYSGAIGRLGVVSRVHPVELRTGDPMTLTLIVSGEGNLEDIRPPVLDDVEGIAGNYRVYDATAETRLEMKQRVFTYSLRPEVAGLTEFPSLPFAYFDVDAEEYKVARTASIPIMVEAAAEIDTTNIVGSDGPRRSRVEATLTGYFANDENLDELIDKPLAPSALGVWLGSLVVVWAGASVVATRQRRLSADPSMKRRREAEAAARKRATAARNPAEWMEVFTHLFADVTGRSAAGMTATEVEAVARECAVDAQLCTNLGAFLAECEAARFAGASAGGGAADARAESLLDETLGELQRVKRLR